jgi:hypothetical protein
VPHRSVQKRSRVPLFWSGACWPAAITLVNLNSAE